MPTSRKAAQKRRAALVLGERSPYPTVERLTIVR